MSLGELAAIGGAMLRDAAKASVTIRDVKPLGQAGDGDLSFLDNPRYIDAFRVSAASACILRAKHAEAAPASMALLISEDPYRAYAKIAQAFYPEVQETADISKGACVANDAVIGKGCRIGHGASIESGATIGEGTSIGANATIGKGVVIGAHCRIGPQVAISHALIGDRAILHPGVRIGQDGFGFAMGKEGHLKVPQLGRVVIGNDVEIGANSCIDRGAGPDTKIGDGAKIDNLVQIAHNVEIGRHTIIVSQVGISGSTKIGDYAVLGGQAGITGHLTIGRGAQVAAQSGVMRNVADGEIQGGTPAMPVRDWHKATATLLKLIKKEKQS